MSELEWTFVNVALCVVSILAFLLGLYAPAAIGALLTLITVVMVNRKFNRPQ